MREIHCRQSTALATAETPAMEKIQAGRGGSRLPPDRAAALRAERLIHARHYEMGTTLHEAAD
jgi:hypothetical protein